MHMLLLICTIYMCIDFFLNLSLCVSCNEAAALGFFTQSTIVVVLVGRAVQSARETVGVHLFFLVGLDLSRHSSRQSCCSQEARSKYISTRGLSYGVIIYFKLLSSETAR